MNWCLFLAFETSYTLKPAVLTHCFHSAICSNIHFAHFPDIARLAQNVKVRQRFVFPSDKCGWLDSRYNILISAPSMAKKSNLVCTYHYLRQSVLLDLGLLWIITLGKNTLICHFIHFLAVSNMSVVIRVVATAISYMRRVYVRYITVIS